MSDVNVSTPQYNVYMRSLIKLLVGDDTLSRWLKKGASDHLPVHVAGPSDVNHPSYIVS